MAKNLMRRRLTLVLVSMGLLLGAVVGWNLIKAHFIRQFMAKNALMPQTVSTAIVRYSTWQPELRSVGSLRAVHGVEVTPQVAGMVVRVEFQSGSYAHAGEALVQLNDAPEVGQLHSLQATAHLDLLTYQRDVIQYKAQAIGKAVLDAATANWKSAESQKAAEAALIAEMTIRAPFSGRLGITTVNPGQYLQAGASIVTLESLDPIYVDFRLPQDDLSRVTVGQTVHVTADAFPGSVFTGRVTSIDPEVDPSTRNFEVQARIANPQRRLKPGMFVDTAVESGAPQRYLTLPQTAISYSPYGDTVFVVRAGAKAAHDPTVEQVFVKLGPTRGDQVAVLHGLSVGEHIVTSGEMKLRNGATIRVNNAVQPLDEPNPAPRDQ